MAEIPNANDSIFYIEPGLTEAFFTYARPSEKGFWVRIPKRCVSVWTDFTGGGRGDVITSCGVEGSADTNTRACAPTPGSATGYQPFNCATPLQGSNTNLAPVYNCR